MFCVTFALLRRRAVGIIGLPNVGKSTLFNALTTSSQAKTGNYPFCTINANTSKVTLADTRLLELARFAKAEKVVPVEVDVTDVAGLIAGASKGEGLGNKFLADIRSCAALLHVVRCFMNERDGFLCPTPLEDIQIIMNELILSDLATVERRVQRSNKQRKSGDAELRFTHHLLNWLQEGKAASLLPLRDAEERQWLESSQLLSCKPMLFVLNVEESAVAAGNAFTAAVEQHYGATRTCRVSAAVEEQTAQLASREERMSFLREYGIDTPRGEIVMHQAFQMLQLQSFFTVGPRMAHGWTVACGATAREAAGEIHSHFGRHFIRAKVLSWRDFIKKPNLESAEMQMAYVSDKYVMQDGDVIIVDHSAPHT